MPLFRFHLRTPSGLEYDPHGLEFPDLDAAYLDACAAVPALSAEFLRAGRDPLVCAFVIADAQDRPLLEMPFRERLRGPRPARRPRDGARPRPPEPETVRQLIEAVRQEHARLLDNLDCTRALLAAPLPDGNAPGPAAAATGAAEGTRER
ncbi:hypothetical protein Q8W71_19845 [Methylobacterium sp. NEAU 140]|uniref:DUF6894 family protein n=1 Tax=Methylobacterium sp. NEAU 140 TaxID=3064945 RepID=UPI0027325E1D|nr:hypothetical protein [Methylobacterium sp. NEAU 140]MDP4024887.1 hypothetical protein [Methylobacterium sp. NEAU 140]